MVRQFTQTSTGIGARIGGQKRNCANSAPRGAVKLAQINWRRAELARGLAELARGLARLA